MRSGAFPRHYPALAAAAILLIAVDRPGTSMNREQAENLLRGCAAAGIPWALDGGTLYFQAADSGTEACVSGAAEKRGFRTVRGFPH